MNTSQPRPVHLPSVVQLLLSGLGVMLFWGGGLLVILLSALDSSFVGGFTMPAAWAVGFQSLILGCLILPSGITAAQRLTGNPDAVKMIQWETLRRVIFIFPAVWIIGVAFEWLDGLGTLFLPLLHVLGIGLPLMWFIGSGGRGLLALTRQRTWGILGFSLTVTPLLILMAELLLGAVALLVVALLLSGEPNFLADLERLVLSLEQAVLPMDQIMIFVESYLYRPEIIIIGVSFVAIVVPLLEEALKPLALLVLLGRKFTPAAGFIGGMITGAGFALFESLSLGLSGTGFGFVIGARIGTGLIHILTAGLTGWGLALAQQERNPLPLLSRYLIAVLIHAAWNGLTALTVVGPLVGSEASADLWNWFAIIGLPLLGVVSFMLLLGINRRLQSALVPTEAPSPEPASSF